MINPYLLIVGIAFTVLQIVGPYFYGFSNWCNVIQYTSGFLDIGVWATVIHFAMDYYRNHKKQIQKLEERIEHLVRLHENSKGAETIDSNPR